MSKVIRINSCHGECPHCTGPDYNSKTNKWQFTCQEEVEWLDNEDIIPDWCPLEDEDTVQIKGETKVVLRVSDLPKWNNMRIIGKENGI